MSAKAEALRVPYRERSHLGWLRWALLAAILAAAVVIGVLTITGGSPANSTGGSSGKSTGAAGKSGFTSSTVVKPAQPITINGVPCPQCR